MNKKNDAGFVAIPESYTRRQLNALYREIPLKDTTSRLLRKYFNAMANLYGISCDPSDSSNLGKRSCFINISNSLVKTTPG